MSQFASAGGTARSGILDVDSAFIVIAQPGVPHGRTLRSGH